MRFNAVDYRPVAVMRPQQPTRGAGQELNASIALVRLDERLTNAATPVHAGWVSRALIQEAVASQRLNGVYVTAHDLTLMLADRTIRIPDHDLRRALDTHRMLTTLNRRNPRHLFTPHRLIALSWLRLRGNASRRDETMPAWLRDHLAVRNPEEMHDALVHALSPETLAACALLPPLTGAAEFLAQWHATGAAERIGPAAGRALAMAWVNRAGTTSGYYLLPSIGFLGHAADYRPDLTTRWPGTFLDACDRAANWGLKLHGRLAGAHQRMHELAPGQRTTSKMATLIDLLVGSPALSAESAARVIGITSHAARALLIALERRGLIQELTGRGSFRLYGLPQ